MSAHGDHVELIDDFANGAARIRDAVAGMTEDELRARPIAGKWSAHEVVCHLADFEVINVARITRTLAEVSPTLPDADPDPFVTHTHYDQRSTATELETISTLRQHLTSILRALEPAQWERVGVHSVDGPLTVQQLVERTTIHIPHHLPFIAAKREALGI